MRQKTIWMHYLPFGISLLFIPMSNSCDDETVEPIKTVQYVYTNDTETDLIMEVFNSADDLIDSYSIPSEQEVITNTTKVEGPAVFFYGSNTTEIGDSIAVKFANNKCLLYSKRANDDIFQVTEYDNYSEELLNQSEYSLKYSFDNSDLEQAVNCE